MAWQLVRISSKHWISRIHDEEHVDEELRMITITIDGDDNGCGGVGDDVDDDGGCDDSALLPCLGLVDSIW